QRAPLRGRRRRGRAGSERHAELAEPARRRVDRSAQVWRQHGDVRGARGERRNRNQDEGVALASRTSPTHAAAASRQTPPSITTSSGAFGLPSPNTRRMSGPNPIAATISGMTMKKLNTPM